MERRMLIWEIAILLGISAGYGADPGEEPNHHFSRSSKSMTQRTHGRDELDHQMFNTLQSTPKNVRRHLMGDGATIPSLKVPHQENTVTELIHKFEVLFGKMPEEEDGQEKESKVSDLIDKYNFMFAASAGNAEGRQGVTYTHIQREIQEIKRKMPPSQGTIKSDHKSDRSKENPS